MNGVLSKDCFIIVGTHCDFVTKIMLASTCLKLRSSFYQCFNLNEWLPFVRNMNWDKGLQYASKNDHRDLVEFFISKGADNWAWALRGASKCGHRDLVDFYISLGADQFQDEY